uniref:Uncharacterized protein n=1 Tax=Candidatus Kentrum sp. LFY TaxID=2126342 RepID=A0A450WHB8_9GAMM|nr:MAG: hypothetical protein BECKLFY1418C_GA0070996_10243 [Candidatus Kentron sp. LFY]
MPNHALSVRTQASLEPTTIFRKVPIQPDREQGLAPFPVWRMALRDPALHARITSYRHRFHRYRRLSWVDEELYNIRTRFDIKPRLRWSLGFFTALSISCWVAVMCRILFLT